MVRVWVNSRRDLVKGRTSPRRFMELQLITKPATQDTETTQMSAGVQTCAIAPASSPLQMVNTNIQGAARAFW